MKYKRKWKILCGMILCICMCAQSVPVCGSEYTAASAAGESASGAGERSSSAGESASGAGERSSSAGESASGAGQSASAAGKSAAGAEESAGDSAEASSGDSDGTSDESAAAAERIRAFAAKYASLSDTDTADEDTEAEDGDVDVSDDAEEEGEDLPEESVDYGSADGTVIYEVGGHGTVSVDGKKVSDGSKATYGAGTKVSLLVKADSGYEIDEISILDADGNYLEYVVGFDAADAHDMTFYVYGGITQTVRAAFTEEETEDPFEGADGTVKFRSTKDTALSRIDSGTVYRSETGALAYCGNAHAHSPGTKGTSMKLDTKSAYQHAYDYIMYYGYPKHTTILDTKYSKKDAHDITQWAIWLIRDPSYYRGTFAANPKLAATAKKLAEKARAYNGGNDKIDGTCLIYYPSNSKKQPMIIVNESKPSQGKLKLKKSSSDKSVTDGNTYYTLKGAGYVVYSDSACKTKVAALETKADGSTDAIQLDAGTYYVKEATAPDGYVRSTKKLKVKITASATTTLKVSETPGSAFLSLQKESANSAISDGNRCYGLYGAVYTVYTDQACTVAAKDTDGNAALLTTGDSGATNEISLYLGDYWIKETTPAKGYALDTAVYKVEIKKKDQHYKVAETRVTDEPQSGYVDFLLQKLDKETGKAAPQGAANLAGAEFTVRYYDGSYTAEEAGAYTAKRTWYFRTDADGRVRFSDSSDYYIGGDALYYDSDGKPTLPLGTVTIEETKEPEGYLKTTEVKAIRITGNGALKTADVQNLAVGDNAVKEQVRRGDLELMKYGETQDDNFSGVRKPLDGVVFTITSKTTGESWKITTDENGIASTKQLGLSARGNLVYDVYTVEETYNPYAEYDRADPFEVELKPSVEQDGKTYYYGIVNMEIFSPIQVVKVDSSTGETIPAAGTEFQILDAQKNVLELTITQYPDRQTATSFVTDESGSFCFPELFDYGTYYLKELHAPEGYLLRGELLEVTIDETHSFDDPLVVKFADENAMGQIELLKTDSDTDEGVGEAEYTVTAAEDIVTPDGTVRLKEGETADVITTDMDGNGCSKRLFLGRYRVQETKAPEGYVLDRTVYGVSLTYKDETTPVVTESLGEIQDEPTTVIVNKYRQGTDESLAGVGFCLWNEAMDEKIQMAESGEDVTGEASESGASEPSDDAAVDPAMAVKETFYTNENGQLIFRYLIPGTYHLQETEPLPGYLPSDTLYTFTVDEDGYTEGTAEYTLTVENEAAQIIQTTAQDPVTLDSCGIARAEAEIVDTVAYDHLIPGTSYTVRGTLMDKTTGEELRVGGEAVRAETLFTAETASGTADVRFCFDASDLKGREIVVFETLYLTENDTEIAAHEDLSDIGQTIVYLAPEIHTTAVYSEDGTHDAPAETICIRDTITYSGLKSGVSYTVKGTLMDRESAGALVIGGETVEAQGTFTPESADGEMEVSFTFDASALEGKELVAFESLYLTESGILLAEHKDLEDADQTVSILSDQPADETKAKKTKTPTKAKSKKQTKKADVPKTGDTSPVGTYVLLIGISAALTGAIVYRRKRRRRGRR